MLQLIKLSDTIEIIKQQIPEIKFAQVIISNDEFVKFLKERKTSDNTMLYVVAPKHKIIGKEDESKYKDFLQLFLIDKTIDKDLSYTAKLELYDKIQGTTRKLIKLLLDAKSGDNNAFGTCNIFSNLEESSIEVDLFWDLFQCRGYEIFLNLQTPL